jgi:hypothetical protein
LGEDRPRVAIETVRKWAYGKATIEEVRQAASSATNAAYAANAATYAANAAYAAYDKALAECAELVRRELSEPLKESV